MIVKIKRANLEKILCEDTDVGFVGVFYFREWRIILN